MFERQIDPECEIDFCNQFIDLHYNDGQEDNYLIDSIALDKTFVYAWEIQESKFQEQQVLERTKTIENFKIRTRRQKQYAEIEKIKKEQIEQRLDQFTELTKLIQFQKQKLVQKEHYETF